MVLPHQSRETTTIQVELVSVALFNEMLEVWDSSLH